MPISSSSENNSELINSLVNATTSVTEQHNALPVVDIHKTLNDIAQLSSIMNLGQQTLIDLHTRMSNAHALNLQLIQQVGLMSQAIENNKNEIENLKSQHESFALVHNQSMGLLQEKETIIFQKHVAYNQLQIKYEELENKFKADIEEKDNIIARKDQANAKLQTDHDELEAQLEELFSENHKTRIYFEKIITTRKNDNKIDQATIEELNTRNAKLIALNDEKDNRYKNLNEQNQTNLSEIEVLVTNNKTFVAMNLELNNTITHLNSELDKATTHRITLEAKISELQKQIKGSQSNSAMQVDVATDQVNSSSTTSPLLNNSINYSDYRPERVTRANASAKTNFEALPTRLATSDVKAARLMRQSTSPVTTSSQENLSSSVSSSSSTYTKRALEKPSSTSPKTKKQKSLYDPTFVANISLRTRGRATSDEGLDFQELSLGKTHADYQKTWQTNKLNRMNK